MSMTHPAENHDGDGQIIPFDYKGIHLAEARGKARRLSPAQLEAELWAMADHYNDGYVTSRHWYRAITEEAARRIGEAGRALNG